MRNRTPGSVFIPFVLIAIIIGFMMVIPLDFAPRSGLSGTLYNFWSQFTNVLSYWLVWLVMALALIMLLIVNGINRVIERKKFVKLSPEDQAQYLEKQKMGFWKRFIKSSREKQTDEEEQEIILDHGFDGIKELDNALPQWWLALFYIGCAYCLVYIIAYFTTDFADQIVEYEVESARLEREFTDWIEANDIKVDQAVITNANLEHGEEIFVNICATCHTANGGGAAGPNLTDEYWINQQDPDLYKHIFLMVYDGSPNNPAMQAFGQTKQLTGLDIQDVAAYIYNMNQDTPPVTEAEGGLAPQGEIVEAWKRK